MAWYDDFFDAAYLEVEQARFSAAQTQREVDFVESHLGLPAGARILDLCCGHGRHSLELARRGYRVLGIDRNREFIAAAAAESRQAGLNVDWRAADMREFVAEHDFDAVVNLFFAWGYLESEADDQQALKVMATALRPGGQLVIEYQNREIVLQHLQNTWRRLANDDLLLREYQFDPATSRVSGSQILVRPDGQRLDRRFDIRLYTYTELFRMLASVGLIPQATFGSYTGQPYGIASPMLIVIARKEA